MTLFSAQQNLTEKSARVSRPLRDEGFTHSFQQNFALFSTTVMLMA